MAFLGALRLDSMGSPHLAVWYGASLGLLGAVATLAILGTLLWGDYIRSAQVVGVGAALGLLGAGAALAILGALRPGPVGSLPDDVRFGATLGLLGAIASLAILGALVQKTRAHFDHVEGVGVTLDPQGPKSLLATLGPFLRHGVVYAVSLPHVGVHQPGGQLESDVPLQGSPSPHIVSLGRVPRLQSPRMPTQEDLPGRDRPPPHSSGAVAVQKLPGLPSGAGRARHPSNISIRAPLGSGKWPGFVICWHVWA